MADSVASAVALPPGTSTKWSSAKPTLSVRSVGLDGISRGRIPERSACSATREDLLAERTEANVAPASTSVPPPVTNAETVTQSVMLHSTLRTFTHQDADVSASLVRPTSLTQRLSDDLANLVHL